MTDDTITIDRECPGGVGELARLEVARIGFGAMQLERLHGDRAAAIDLVRHAIDLGVDHLDTAEFYGDGFVNSVLGEALGGGGLGGAVQVVSKVGAEVAPGGRGLRPAQRPEQLRASVEANLRSLGVERIPVVNLRRMDAGIGIRADGDQAVGIDDQLAAMVAMRDEGMIGAIGLSSMTIEGLRRALPIGVACVQNAYSLVARGDEDMLELCLAEGVAWVPYFPLGSAFAGLPKVTDEPEVISVAEALGVTPSEVGLAWLLQHAPNVLLIPGTADARHLEANLAVGSLTLDAESVARLDAIPTREVDLAAFRAQQD
ncbi:aldo/keto reductase [Leifsonia sp. McL0607]|uniref:aldo/keto reductase n=1 Tax=Leifsonia sp. McL0607 TaxID=3415672 RepID=UPI003CE761D3